MDTETSKNKVSARQREIARQYLAALDKHIRDLREGSVDRALEIREFASMLHVHPVHLSNTIKEVTNRSTCDLYEDKLLELSKELLLTTTLSVAQIARQLTYDPSNFGKFFKAYTGSTPKNFRDAATDAQKKS